MWTDHLWGFHWDFNIIHVKAPALTDTAWAEGEDASIETSAKKEKKKSQTQDAGALAGFSSDNPSQKSKGVPKCSFNCRPSIKASKWGRLGGTLAHQTDTRNTHHLYSRLLKKRKKDQSFSRWKGSVPCIYTPPFTHSLFYQIKKAGFGRHVKRTFNNYGDAPTQPLPLITGLWWLKGLPFYPGLSKAAIINMVTIRNHEKQKNK